MGDWDTLSGIGRVAVVIWISFICLGIGTVWMCFGFISEDDDEDGYAALILIFAISTLFICALIGFYNNDKYYFFYTYGACLFLIGLVAALFLIFSAFEYLNEVFFGARRSPSPEVDYGGWTNVEDDDDDFAYDDRARENNHTAGKKSEPPPPDDIDFSEVLARAQDMIKGVSDAAAANTAKRCEKLAEKEENPHTREVLKAAAALLRERAKGYAGRREPAKSEAELKKLLLDPPRGTRH